jgi:hypothetical protein
MICPKCQFEQPDDLLECLKCGIVFSKFNVPAIQTDIQPSSDEQDAKPSKQLLAQLLIPIPHEVNPVILGCKAVLFFLLAIWSLKFIFASIESNYVGQSFMHLVNLPFHEAGHIFFSFFGRFMQVLGGTLGQLIMPAICAAVLLFQTRDGFGAAVATWWLAESFMDIAPYINDARALNLVLLGGFTGKDVQDYHDWEYILGRLGMLKMDHLLAYTVQTIGIILMLIALVWAAMNLWQQLKIYRKDHLNVPKV